MIISQIDEYTTKVWESTGSIMQNLSQTT